ncbi:MAG TPA: tetratricopeptide repeat protein [Opitutaceae bacterium]|nr:tetratricopeptide repeat protein [Opitutaceae bacterium]
MTHRLAHLVLVGLCASTLVCASPAEHGSTPAAEPVAAAASESTTGPAIAKEGQSPAPEASPDEVAQSLLVLARRLVERNDNDAAETAYIEVLNSPVSEPVLQDALIAYAEFLRKSGKDARAAATYEKFLADYAGSPRATTVLIALGRTLRDMGAFDLAQARFYAVLNSTLAVSPENIQRYRDLAQLAKFEIAETYYQQGDYASASKFFGRIKLLELPPEDRARATFREAYSFFLDGKLDLAVASLRSFLQSYPGNTSAQEARYLLCLALRRLGRTQDALVETLTLLRSAQAAATADRELWSYWQRRTGNQLANDFYEQGDFNSALTIYQTLAELRSDPIWRWPALYQIGLCYERLRQPERASSVYRDILAEATAAKKVGTELEAAAHEVRTMAEWRLSQIDWANNVDTSVRGFTAHQAPASTPLGVE